MAKLSTGYWSRFDPTNGYTAIAASMAAQLPLHRYDFRCGCRTHQLTTPSRRAGLNTHSHSGRAIAQTTKRRQGAVFCLFSNYCAAWYASIGLSNGLAHAALVDADGGRLTVMPLGGIGCINQRS